MSLLADCIHKVTTLIRHEAAQGTALDTWTGAVTKDTGINECPFVVFDTELSGLNVRKDFIVSIGAIKMTGGTIHAGDAFSRLVRAEGQLTQESIVIHEITPDDLVNQKPLEQVLPEFFAFIKDTVLIGHFLHFDLRFINKSIKNHFSSELRNPSVDTHNIHDWLHKNAGDFKKHFAGGSLKTDLFSVAEKYGVAVDAGHDALYDAYVTAQLFQRFIPFLLSNSIRTLGDLIDIGRA